MSTLNRITLLFVCILSIVLLSGCNTDKNSLENIEIIKIGGIVATETSSRSIDLLVSEINKNDGLHGKQIQFVLEKCKEENDAINAYNKLIRENISILIVSLSKESSTAVAKLAQNDKVPVVVSSSRNINITSIGDYVYNTSFQDINQGTLCADFVKNILLKKKIAILYNNDDPYSKNIALNFKKTVESNNNAIVFEKAYTNTDQDFSPVMVEMKDEDPDVLFIPDKSNKVSLIAKQVRAFGMSNTILVGESSWNGIENTARREIVDSYYSTYFAADSKDPNVVEFVTKYKALYNNEIPSESDALLYESLSIVIDAIKSAGTVDKEKVRNSLGKIEGSFLTGKFKFDENRNPHRSFVICRINTENGDLLSNYFTSIMP